MKTDKNGRCKKHDWAFWKEYGIDNDNFEVVSKCKHCNKKKSIKCKYDFKSGY